MIVPVIARRFKTGEPLLIFPGIMAGESPNEVSSWSYDGHGACDYGVMMRDTIPAKDAKEILEDYIQKHQHLSENDVYKLYVRRAKSIRCLA